MYVYYNYLCVCGLIHIFYDGPQLAGISNFLFTGHATFGYLCDMLSDWHSGPGEGISPRALQEKYAFSNTSPITCSMRIGSERLPRQRECLNPLTGRHLLDEDAVVFMSVLF